MRLEPGWCDALPALLDSIPDGDFTWKQDAAASAR
jgi:hypothetical protein